MTGYNLFPPLDIEDPDALRGSIAIEGQLDPIIKNEQGVNCLVRHRPVLVLAKGDFKASRFWKTSLPNAEREKDVHEWQQPLPEGKHPIEWLTRPSDLIVYPCRGSLTTAIAACQLGRRCVSCERDERWYSRGIDRWKQVTSNPEAGSTAAEPLTLQHPAK